MWGVLPGGKTMAKGKYPKKPTFRYFVKDEEGNPVNIDTLTEEERIEIGKWAYRNLLKGLGYEPVMKNNKY